jgi:hypothetical protein
MSIAATFWSFAAMTQYVAAIPYTQNAVATGPYLWSNQGQGNQFARPNGSPGCRVGAVVGQFLFLADLYQQQQQTLFTGNGSQNTFSGFLSTPMAAAGSILDQQGTLGGTFNNGLIAGSGYLASGTVNYATGAIALTFGTAPPNGDAVYAQYIQEAPYRCWWSSIGDPTTWPTPLTNAAIAAQSGYNDLQVDLGPIMFVAGYPLYGLVFQRFGITRAQYIGGNVVWSWQPYEFKRGCIAHGAAIKVGPIVYFLADDGFWYTDGANVLPVGTAGDNSAGIDNWLWEDLNTSALEAIRAGYDSTKRCIFFAIPTGTNTLPDTLLIYNLLAQRWTRAAIATETLWTADNGANGVPGTRQLLGIMDQTHTPDALTGAPLTGYLESCDIYATDGNRRTVTGVRPHVNATDLAYVTVGSRDNLSDPVIYASGDYQDSFSKVAPAMSGGIYNRVRVQSTNAQSFQGATLLLEQNGGI